MHKMAFEKCRDLEDLLQDTTTIDEYLSLIREYFSCHQVLDFEVPDRRLIVPFRSLNNMLQLDKFVAQIIFLLDILQVLPDLGCLRVKLGP